MARVMDSSGVGCDSAADRSREPNAQACRRFSSPIPPRSTTRRRPAIPSGPTACGRSSGRSRTSVSPGSSASRRRSARAAMAELAHPAAYVTAIEEAGAARGHDRGSTRTRPCRRAPSRRRCAAPAPPCSAVDEVMTGRVGNAFSAMRPPGHHAERDPRHGLLLLQQRRDRRPARADGARRRARRDRRLGRPSRQRHAGHLLERPDACSTARPTRCRSIPAPARSPSAASTTPSSMRRCAPGDGGDGLPRGVRDARSCRASRAFRPDLIIISAGFDAHRRDPLGEPQPHRGRFRLGDAEADGARRQRAAAAASSRVLEGGYDLDGLSRNPSRRMSTALMGASRQRSIRVRAISSRAPIESARRRSPIATGAGDCREREQARGRRSGRQATQPRARARSRQAPRGGSGSAPSAPAIERAGLGERPGDRERALEDRDRHDDRGQPAEDRILEPWSAAKRRARARRRRRRQGRKSPPSAGVRRRAPRCRSRAGGS